jgi:hypothetical protein
MFRKKRIIHLQLAGRLGNQLFQLAYAHELARMFDCEIQPFFDAHHRSSEETSDLVTGNYFCKHVRPARAMNRFGMLITLFDKLGVYFNRNHISFLLSHLRIHRQVDSHLPGPKLQGKPWLVTGFYIDQKYAAINEETLVTEILEFARGKCIASKNLEKIKTLGAYQIMHIRRGDFVNNGANFGLLSLEYYLSNRTKTSLVLAIENQSEVSKFAEILNPDVILTKENSTVWETLLAFSAASDVVISNSTYAWWGGFLASCNGNVVRIPEPFYLNQDSVNRYFRYKYFSPIKGIFSNDEN